MLGCYTGIKRLPNSPTLSGLCTGGDSPKLPNRYTRKGVCRVASKYTQANAADGIGGTLFTKQSTMGHRRTSRRMTISHLLLDHKSCYVSVVLAMPATRFYDAVSSVTFSMVGGVSLRHERPTSKTADGIRTRKDA